MPLNREDAAIWDQGRRAFFGVFFFFFCGGCYQRSGGSCYGGWLRGSQTDKGGQTRRRGMEMETVKTSSSPLPATLHHLLQDYEEREMLNAVKEQTSNLMCLLWNSWKRNSSPKISLRVVLLIITLRYWHWCNVVLRNFQIFLKATPAVIFFCLMFLPLLSVKLP